MSFDESHGSVMMLTWVLQVSCNERLCFLISIQEKSEFVFPFKKVTTKSKSQAVTLFHHRWFSCRESITRDGDTFVKQRSDWSACNILDIKIQEFWSSYCIWKIIDIKILESQSSFPLSNAVRLSVLVNQQALKQFVLICYASSRTSYHRLTSMSCSLHVVIEFVGQTRLVSSKENL